MHRAHRAHRARTRCGRFAPPATWRAHERFAPPWAQCCHYAPMPSLLASPQTNYNFISLQKCLHLISFPNAPPDIRLLHESRASCVRNRGSIATCTCCARPAGAGVRVVRPTRGREQLRLIRCDDIIIWFWCGARLYALVKSFVLWRNRLDAAAAERTCATSRRGHTLAHI